MPAYTCSRSSMVDGGSWAPAVEAVHDERCVCGNLMARLTAAGVEILCRRCKRKHLVRWVDQWQDHGSDAMNR